MSEEEGLIEEAGGEDAEVELKARDPSFFAIPWDPPDLDAIRDDRPSMVTVATNEQLTEIQRVHIRTDATVRSNRVWKGRYDRYNGQYFIDALKDALLYPQPPEEPKKKKKDILEEMGEGEGERNAGAEGEGEGLGEGEEDVGEDREAVEERDPAEMILNALKFVQEKHDELWKLEELDKLCKEYQRKAGEIQETKRDWKMRITKIQMDWASKMTDEFAERQEKLVKMKEELEDYLLLRALKRYELKKYLRQVRKFITMMRENQRLAEQRARENAEAEAAHEESMEEQTIEERKIRKLEAMKKALLSSIKPKKEDKQPEKAGMEELLEEEQFNFEEQDGEGRLENEGENEYGEFHESTIEDKSVAAPSPVVVENHPQPTIITKDGLQYPVHVQEFGFKVKQKNPSDKKGQQKEERYNLKDLIQIKTYTNEKGILVKEIPLYITVPDDYPNKRVIGENLKRAVELSKQVPETNPYELALCKTVGQEVFHQLQNRNNSVNRAARHNLPMAGSRLKQLLPWRKHGFALQSKMNWVTGLYDSGPFLYKLQSKSIGASGLADSLRFLSTVLRPRPKFAKVGNLRYMAGRTVFVPELRIFDHKTREILKRNKKEELAKLPVTTFRVADSIATYFMEPPGPSEADEHVTFRGAIKKLEGKSLMRIIVEETLSPEEYRQRYKGRKWMERKLTALYNDFTDQKNEVLEKGIVGRQSADRRDGVEPTCCPILWGMANYLRSILETADGKSISTKHIPRSFKDLKQFFQEVVLEMRPELKLRSQELDTLLTKWGGYDMCKIDLVSIANLMWILAEIEELKPYWVEIRETLIDSSTCPLCLLFDFLKGKNNKIPRMRFMGDSRKTFDKWNMPNELMDLEKIATEFKNMEKPPMDPALFPDNNSFHILTTEDEHKNPTTYRLGQHTDATRLFVMRSCGTVIFDISRSQKEIPWIWSYLRQHMELLDKKDVRDETDVEPMRHLILISNFLSWAKSPKEVLMNISEKTFQQRVPHPDYAGNLKLENTVYYIGVNYKQFKLRTTIIFSGIPFGEEEDVLVYLFKMAWDNELELPLFGSGKNVLPLIHIMDLKWIVVRTVNERTYPAMIFALNKNDQTLFAMASRIAKKFGSTKVVKFPSPDFVMKFCIPKIIDDLLKQNIRYDSVENPYQVRPVWHNPFTKQNKIDEVIRELRDSRKLYGKSIFLIGPPSKAKSELAIIISKLYNLPLIHKGNILNYFLRATQEPEPSRGEGEEEEELGEEGEEEEEPEKDEEEEGEDKKTKKPADPMAEEKKYLKIMKKMIDGKPANRERKHLTKLLQKLLQSVFIQSHGYVLVDWPIRKEDAIALFTKTLDEPQDEEEIEAEPKPPQPPPPRPDYVINVAAPDQYLDETNYFLFQDLCLKSFSEMESDLREYQYYRQIHQSVVDLFEERNTPIYRLTAHDGFKVVGKIIAILGEPQQASGRSIYEMFLKTELACSDDAIKKGERKMKEAKWLKNRYKHAINELLTYRRERHFSLREQLLGNPLDIFKNSERISPNLRSIVYEDYQEWRDMTGMMKLKKKWTEPSRVWRHVENRRWIASFEKTKEYWMK
uniref:Adenylate kinase 7 n=1 Tax=Lygus hesperus TaxID=30085 RepID=A0A0A9Z041_LYGHE